MWMAAYWLISVSNRDFNFGSRGHDAETTTFFSLRSPESCKLINKSTSKNRYIQKSLYNTLNINRIFVQMH
jgi:hypothetical protein